MPFALFKILAQDLLAWKQQSIITTAAARPINVNIKLRTFLRVTSGASAKKSLGIAVPKKIVPLVAFSQIAAVRFSFLHSFEL